MSERLTDEQLRLLIRISPDEYEVEAATEILALRARNAQLEGLETGLRKTEMGVHGRSMEFDAAGAALRVASAGREARDCAARRGRAQ